jgi:Amt family ammonium transporter
VTPIASILIGLGAGVFCYWAVQLRAKLTRIDDALDVWGVHGVGGTWGAIATGLFATVAVNPTAANGLFYGDPSQLLKQLAAVAVTWVYAGALTWIILKLIDITIGLRVEEKEEVLGLDTTQHGEVAYQL